MELPSWLDEDILFSVGYWMLVIGVWVALLIGFKGADSGLFGISDSSITIPLLTKILLMLSIPLVAYFVSMKVFR